MGPEVSVENLMVFQLAAIGKVLITNRADVLLPGAVVFVAHEQSICCASFLTTVTVEGTLTVLFLFVCFQSLFSFEGAMTNITLIHGEGVSRLKIFELLNDFIPTNCL